MQDPEATYVGLEPLCSAYRVKRWEQFTATTKRRYALMIDTGAPSSCVGLNWVLDFIRTFKLENVTAWDEFQAQLSGIGQGAAHVNWKVTLPIGLCPKKGTLDGNWQAQCLEGIGVDVPPLLGLDALTSKKAVLDFRAKPYTLECDTAAGRTTFKLDLVGGHIMLPVDWGGIELGSRDAFYLEPLGLNTPFDIDPSTYNLLDYTSVSSKEKESESPEKFEQFAQFDENLHSNTTFPNQLTPPPPPSPEEQRHVESAASGPAPLELPTGGRHTNAQPSLNPKSKQVHAETSRAFLAAPVPLELPTGNRHDTVCPKPPAHAQSPAPNSTNHKMVSVHNPAYRQFIAAAAVMQRAAKPCAALLKNQTYKKKYQGLPADTPIPDLTNMLRGKWDFWELWAGSAELTKACKDAGLRCGPPITHATGWCLSLPHHRAKIKELLLLHRPEVLFGAPLCSVWSNSNTTMHDDIKDAIKAEQMIMLMFFHELSVLQTNAGRAHGLEQPQSSELLRTSFGEKQLALEAEDSVVHMCQHGLCDHENKKPNLKPTTIRATRGLVTSRVARRCKRNHIHQQLQGLTRNGKLRTTLAQTYTKLFCSRFAADIHGFIKHKPSAYPSRVRNEDSEDEVAAEDPYEEVPDDTNEPETDLERAARVERLVERAKARRLANPAPTTPTPALFPPKLVPTAKKNPKRAPGTPEDVDFQPLAVELSSPPGLPPPRPASSSKDVISVDALAPAPLVPVAEGVIEKRRPTDEAQANHLDQMIIQRKRFAPGNSFIISTGPRLAVIQELFGTPHGKTVLVAVLARLPTEQASPEPMISRHIANLSLVMTKDSEDAAWSHTPWGPYDVKSSRYKRRPQWQFTAFGHERLGDDLADHVHATPLETVAEQADRDAIATRSLPVVLKGLVEGNSEEQISIILALHKRLYHRKSGELRELLNKSGVPMRVLTLVEEACNRCEVCRRWSAVSTKAAVKTRLSGRFNHMIYADLVFVGQPPSMYFVCVDDAIRYTTVAYLEYKNIQCLEKILRRSWIQHYGPPQIIRSDREGSMASEAFGVVCEKLGIKRELVTAGESHGFLGPLDRRVQIIRNHAPILMDLLSEAHINIEYEDLAAEMQIDLNTGLSYAGTTPYTCLYGVQPRPVFFEDSEEITASSDNEPFYEHQQVRLRSCSAFQQALLQYRVQRASTARPRKEFQASYSVGDVVDVFRKPKAKDLSGWRGPATVLALVGEGLITIRWQSTVFDAPIHHIRPHINISETKSLPPAVQPPPETSKSSSAIRKLMNTWDSEEAEVDKAIRDVSAKVQSDEDAEQRAAELASSTAIFGLAHPVSYLASCHHQWEAFYNEEAADQLKDHQTYFDTLSSLTASMPTGTVQNHSVEVRKGVLSVSRDAQRDLRAIFSVGQHLARAFGIQSYAGIILAHGRRHLPVLPGIHSRTCIYWINEPAVNKQLVLDGSVTVDFLREGVALENLKDLKCICILEALPQQQSVLRNLLAELPEEIVVEEPREIGRVRSELTSEPDVLRSSPHELGDTTTLSETAIASSVQFEQNDVWDPSLSSSEVFAIQLRSIAAAEFNHETSTSNRHVRSMRNRHALLQNHETTWNSCMSTTSSRDPRKQSEAVFYFDAESMEDAYFPLDKDCRPLNESELQSEAPAIEESQLKELKSWIANHTGKPVLKKTFEADTGLKGLSSRWVIEYKRKEGKKIVKARMCIRGFEERNQSTLNCSSPTATKLGHRIVAQTSATKKWPLESLDVSTAFLQGYRFDSLPPGISRQPCAFSPPKGTFALLASLDKVWADAAAHPDQYLFLLEKAAYGLKDAPLLWFVAINAYLIGLGYRSTSHDPCCYKKLNDQHLGLLLSLHVDDTLCTGPEEELNVLHGHLEKRFGTVKRERNHFRHFGVDTFKCMTTHHVWLDQRDYLTQLKPITINRKRGDGRTAESPITADEVTLYRSLVSAIAWLGTTYAPALAGASLYQTYLPVPSVANVLHLNNLLDQFVTCYSPLIIRSDIVDPVIIAVSDSSLGNVAKYSQGGYWILLANRRNDGLCGICSILTYRSSKSKRVASSSLHAETLALVGALEEASLVQTFLHEINHPSLTTLELVNASPSELVSIVGVTDCHDLLDTLCKSTAPILSNKAMQLYTTVLREFRETERVSAWAWCDTRDNIANGLTKLESDGTLPIKEITQMLQCAAWEPQNPFRWGLQLVESVAQPFPVMPSPPPITKVASKD